MKQFKTQFGHFTFTAKYITTPAEARSAASIILDKNGPCALDIETAKLPEFKDHKQAGLDPYLSRIRLVQIYDGKDVWVFDLFHVPLKILGKILTTKRFIGHNSVFEIKHLLHAGISGINIGCSMLMSQMITTAEHSPYEPDEEETALLEEEPDGLSKYKRKGHSLEAVSGRYLDIRLSKEQQLSDWGVNELTTDQIVYAAGDAFVTYKLGEILYPKIVFWKMEKHYELLKRSQHAVAEMELTGVAVNWKEHEDLVEKWDDLRADAQRKGYGYFKDTNLNSSKQMGVWLEKYFKREPNILAKWPKTGKGAYSFNAFSLTNFKQIEPIKHLLQYKEYMKLVSTYGEGISKLKNPVTKRLHSSFTLGETQTGRMSSKNPNGQNFPRDKEFRNVFQAPEGRTLIVADLSQIELRLQAELSRDPVMQKVYKNGKDIYKVMAASLLKKSVDKVTDDERQTGKIIMLALGYGMGAPKLEDQAWRQYGVRIDGKRAHAAYRNTFSTYINWCDKERHKVSELGFGRTQFGKMRRMLSNEVYTRAPNFRVQGGAAELIMLSLCRLQNRLTDSAKILSCIHDEIIVECDDDKRIIKDAIGQVEESMNGAFAFMFPKAASHKVATAHAGKSWALAKG